MARSTPAQPSMTAMDRKYRAEDDCRTLERAEEIREDKSRMSHATGHARDQVKRMKKIAGGARGRTRRR